MISIFTSLFTGMTGRMKGHPALDDGETLIHACYGLGAKIVAVGNRAASRHSNAWDVPQSGEEGLAAAINRSGVVALTDRRLIFFAKRFSIGTPKAVTAQWPLSQVVSVKFENDNLMIEFEDGSVAGLHVPPLQKPKRFVEKFQSLSVD